jgi:DNA-binding NtrC family response regulator
VDLRCVVSATATIETEVGDGRVRDDLYRRVSVTRIDVPSLRKRREDIPAIANYVLRQICAAKELPARSFSRSALSLLCALPWRGQVTELRRLLETVAAGPAGRSVALDELLAHIRLDADSVMFFDGGTLRQARARFEHEYIKTVLDQHRGRISEAAKALGIQRTNLYRKMRSLSVSRVRSR